MEEFLLPEGNVRKYAHVVNVLFNLNVHFAICSKYPFNSYLHNLTAVCNKSVITLSTSSHTNKTRFRH